jgi:hypothetical protein
MQKCQYTPPHEGNRRIVSRSCGRVSVRSGAADSGWSAFYSPSSSSAKIMGNFSGDSASCSCPCPNLAHGGENILVVTVPEPEATGPDLVFLQAGECQSFYAVRLGNPGVQMPVHEKENLADRSDASAVFCTFSSSSRPQRHPSFSASKIPFPGSPRIEAISHQWSTLTRTIIDTNHIRHDGRRRPTARQPIMAENDWRLGQFIRFPLVRWREPHVRHARIWRKNGFSKRSFGIRFEPPANPDLSSPMPVLIDMAESFR